MMSLTAFIGRISTYLNSIFFLLFLARVLHVGSDSMISELLCKDGAISYEKTHRACKDPCTKVLKRVGICYEKAVSETFVQGSLHERSPIL
jgi:hypothetical protein